MLIYIPGHCGYVSVANENVTEIHKYFKICCIGVPTLPKKKISCVIIM